MLTLILAESALELIPESLTSYQVIASSAKKRNKKTREILLDSSYHYSAMKNLEDADRRGRPDIIHIFLLNALESIANKQGKMQIIIHTRNNEKITIDSSTRIIKNYERFIGLIEQLFQKQILPDEKNPLLKLEKNKDLQTIVKEIKSDFTIGLSIEGKQVKMLNYFKDLKKKNHEHIACIVGGFPKGDFNNDIKKLTDQIVSIYPEMLTAWTVTNEIIVNYENVYL